MTVLDTVEDRSRSFWWFYEAQIENEAFIISGELICPRAGSHGTTKRLRLNLEENEEIWASTVPLN